MTAVRRIITHDRFGVHLIRHFDSERCNVSSRCSVHSWFLVQNQNLKKKKHSVNALTLKIWPDKSATSPVRKASTVYKRLAS